MSDSPEIIILSSGGVMILILLSLFGNILVCFAVYYSRNLRTRVNYLIISLAVADIMVATMAMPIWIYSEITGFQKLSDEATHNLVMFWNFVDILGGISSIANLTVISYERLWSVCSPLNHRRYLNNIVVALLIALAWVYAIAIASTTIPFIHEQWSVMFTAVLGFFLPLFFIVMAYFSIFVIVNRSPRNVITPQDNSRINITICIIIGLFFICWAPHFIVSILSQYCDSCHVYIRHNLWIRSVTVWLHYANSFVNPIVYGLANAQYKEAFKLVLKKIVNCLRCGSNKSTTEKTNTNNNKTTTNFLARPMFPQSKPEFKQKDKELVVELSLEEKEDNRTRYPRDVTALDEYPPGDYRAIPVYRDKRKPYTRWDSGETEATYLYSGTFEDTSSLQRNLLNPESLARTSYL